MIKIGIAGYGNLGRGVELAIKQNKDMELTHIFTRRKPDEIKPLSDAKVVAYTSAQDYKDVIDVLILCGGSATDLPNQGPEMAEHFNTVDSFDTHVKIPEYFRKMDSIAKAHQHVNLISCGWDPGMFSIMRTLFSSILPNGKTSTFWGKGVSQGHSDAVRHIEGVLDARQYTIPYPEAIAKAKNKDISELTTREKHWRSCYVVAAEGADQAKIREAIVTMPAYFSDYNTEVHFISMAEMKANHNKLAHGGIVIRNGKTSDEHNEIAEFNLTLDSNPEFTSSVLVAYARAIYRLKEQKAYAAYSVLDIAPALLAPMTREDLLKDFV